MKGFVIYISFAILTLADARRLFLLNAIGTTSKEISEALSNTLLLIETITIFNPNFFDRDNVKCQIYTNHVCVNTCNISTNNFAVKEINLSDSTRKRLTIQSQCSLHFYNN